MFRTAVLLVTCMVSYSLANPNTRIVGGISAESGDAPWMVSMRNSLNIHFCGGTLLNRRFVLTAATCLVGRLPSSTMAVVGSLTLTGLAAPYYGRDIVTHSHWDQNTLQFNVALFRTVQSVIYSSGVQPIELTEGNLILPGSRARIYGWGFTIPGLGNSNELQYLNVNTIDSSVCRVALGPDASRVGPSSVCALNRVGQGLCTNDAGGALVVDNKAIAVASWMFPCATGRPDVYVRISAIRDWIAEII